MHIYYVSIQLIVQERKINSGMIGEMNSNLSSRSLHDEKAKKERLHNEIVVSLE